MADGLPTSKTDLPWTEVVTMTWVDCSNVCWLRACEAWPGSWRSLGIPDTGSIPRWLMERQPSSVWMQGRGFQPATGRRRFLLEGSKNFLKQLLRKTNCQVLLLLKKFRSIYNSIAKKNNVAPPKGTCCSETQFWKYRKKATALWGKRTLDLLIMRHVLYHCAAATGLKVQG